MKNTLLFLSVFAISIITFAQPPQGFNYQAIARDGSGTPMISATVSVRLSILQGVAQTEVYKETHSVTTNQFGLFNAVVGKGTPVSGNFSGIDWSAAEHYIKVELNPGSGFVTMGISELVSVPYSLYSAKSGDADLTLNDLTDVTAAGPSVGQVLKWDGTNWFPDTDNTGTGDNWGTQAVSTDTSLSGDGTSANKLKIAQHGATSGQVLKWNGSTWMPSADLTLWTQNGNDIYYNAGEVGIGLTAPQNVLHLRDTLNPGIAFDDGGELFNITENSDGQLQFSANNVAYNAATVVMTLDDNTRNVGIGTATPTATLHIEDNSARGTPQLLLHETQATDYARLSFSNSSSATSYWDIAAFTDTTAANERMNFYKSGVGNIITITGDSKVGINVSPAADLHIKQSGSPNAEGGLRYEYSSNTNYWQTGIAATNNFWFVYNGTLASFILTDGTYTASDRNLKEDVQDYGNVLDKVLQLKPASYKYQNSSVEYGDKKPYSIGFIAQEVEEIFPELVIEQNGNKALCYDNFAVIAIAAIKEQQKMIEQLKVEVEELKGKD